MNEDHITPAALHEALNFAQSVLTDAGEIALRHFRQQGDVENKLQGGDFDPVTQADREVESFLRDKLGAQFPEYGIIGEEEGGSEGPSGFSWVIDPIDGTKAFISGQPTWGMLLGLMHNGKALAGLMHQPFTGELFVGSAEGAFLWRNSLCTPLKVSRTAELAQAILYSTHESMFVAPENREAFQRVAEQVKLQRFGGDCYSYCMLAHGLIDLVIEDTLQPYDIIPLIPIVEAAGGVVTNESGNSPISGGFVVAAATPELHREALGLINL